VDRCPQTLSHPALFPRKGAGGEPGMVKRNVNVTIAPYIMHALVLTDKGL